MERTLSTRNPHALSLLSSRASPSSTPIIRSKKNRCRFQAKVVLLRPCPRIQGTTVTIGVFSRLLILKPGLVGWKVGMGVGSRHESQDAFIHFRDRLRSSEWPYPWRLGLITRCWGIYSLISLFRIAASSTVL